MIPFVMMALSLAQKKQQQDQADNDRILNSLNIGDSQQNNTKLQVPNGNPIGGVLGGQGGAIGLLGSLFNKNDPRKPNQF